MDLADVLSLQLSMTSRTLQMLREHGVGEDDQCSVDYFFHPPDQPHAEALAAALRTRGGTAEINSQTTGRWRKKTQWTVWGSWAPMVMAEAVVTAWVTDMVELGSQHESQFDGWGTPA